MLRWPVTTGLASGSTLNMAIARGLLEIIERDAFMIFYMNKLRPPEIDLEEFSTRDMEIKNILASFRRYNLELKILALPTDFPVHVSLAVVVDKTGLGPSLSVGAKASFNQKDSVLGSISEALSVRTSRKKDFTEGYTGKPENMGRTGRLKYWSHPNSYQKFDFALGGKKIKMSDKDAGRINDSSAIETIVKHCHTKRYDSLYVRLSDKSLEKTGLYVAMTIVPELQPMHLLESIPYLGGNRLQEIPLSLGHEPAGDLNSIPHPFP